MKIGLDLDGTILDCKPRQTRLLAALCRACALSVDTERYWHLKRRGYSNRTALIRMGVDEHRTETVATLWEYVIEDICWLGFDPLLPGAIDTLHRWKESGHSLHLLSARRNHANAHQQLRVLGLDCFNSVDFVNPFEPHAKRSALAKLCPDIYIGDTERDAQCADAAGVSPILISSGLRDTAFLQRSTKCPVVERLSDALSRIARHS
ncbi:MAG: HAD family hydrolase [Proteobacteria bacterium]|nr:HAD family hydrolase [Pseudomonadota bacterium]